ncbi:MAG TPA: glycoside hydrolase family 2 TIM barrel-domain containing protein [Solirubrobacteraceae bacterium]|nr:glycoside hydrolase family 2 TIM barrel-domain containing protein [Solirubrobacteraceae bacterium]
MNSFATKLVLAVVVACVALGASAVAAQGPAGSSLLAEGPGGRTALTRWTLRKDPANRGLSLGWQRGGFGGAAVSVPNVVSAHPYAGRAAEANYEGSVAWYRTSFDAPAAGAYGLTFQSANFLAQVWVDGHAVGSHRGSYLAFELRRALSAGEHTVVVRVDWRNPGAQERLGFHRTWFNWGGLDGEVNVRRIGASELSEPTIQTTLSSGATVVCVRAPCPAGPEGATATVKVGVQVRNDGASAQALAVSGALARGGQTVPLSFPEVRLAAGQSASVTATATVSDPALWSPATPSLYELSLAAGAPSASSSFSARVGLRQISWHGGEMYLNGRRLTMHGASIQEDARGHGDALTPGDEDRIVGEVKAIGANAVRSQHPLDPALLERFDAAGILVWQGIGPVEGAGNWYSSSPSLLAAAESQARRGALGEELHPSVIVWNLVDEIADNGRNGAEVAYVESMAGWLHEHDPTRLVAVDVWGDHPPTHAGALYRDVDAVAETDYSGWYDNPRDSPAGVSAEIKRRLAAMERTFPGKVLTISEFGAESNTLNPSGAPGGYSFQSALLARHIRAYAADPALSGMFVYLLRDYPLNPTFYGGSIHGKLPRLRLIESLNQKGLFTYSGAAKPAASVVSALYGALPRV